MALKITPRAGSENPLLPEQKGLYDVKGADRKQLSEAALICYPSTGVTGRIAQSKSLVTFKSINPGPHVIIVAAYDKPSGSKKGKVVTGRYEITVEGDPPPPTPPPSGDIAAILIIEESKDRTVNQGELITSAEVRDQVAEYGWTLHVIDDDATDQSGGQPEALSKWLKKATSLPWWFFVTDAGDAIVSEPLPNNVQSALEVIRSHKP